MALSQPKGGAHTLARKRMMEAALAKSRGSTGQLKSPSSVHSQDRAASLRQDAVRPLVLGSKCSDCSLLELFD